MDGWRPARHLTGGDGRVLVEDSDPHRDCFDRPAAEPLDTAGTRAWAAGVAEAWKVVHRDAPAYADGLREGLRAVTPLRPAAGGGMHSATARDAFGAVGVAYTADSAALAVMLVHEFQHSKLGAVLDVLDLADPGGPAHRPGYTVGWRSDPRPVEGVLQGTYAHLAVADMWRARMLHDERDHVARSRYRMYRDWTEAGAETLRTCGSLTPAGVRFVACMADTLGRWEG
ncbi:HEXXH motif-containing putative peptide modification protein [Dactylosporangium sp. NBC_01737]|uniref:aKG-HExxH-type peptide beta-hydroxylase n=1 Tax=Dactylosporangium sp. NBC_01737 TaxID=2975959 RepID=UPI002E1512CD|nr:HEXXH motif-containing putative peptide modification protein [Dactylosporangium sp. NBC_01737]